MTHPHTPNEPGAEPERLTFHGTTSTTITLPDPHLTTPGTTITIDTGEWECVHEGPHAFWEALFTLTITPPPTSEGWLDG